MRQLALFASAASPMRLVGDRGDVTYVPEFLDRALADAVVRELQADTCWKADSRLMYGRRVLVPRETAGRGEKMPQPWTPALGLVREMVERHTGTTFDYCFLNRYRNGNDARSSTSKVQSRRARSSTPSRPAIQCCAGRSATRSRRSAVRSCGSSPASRIFPMSCPTPPCPVMTTVTLIAILVELPHLRIAIPASQMRV